MKKAMSGFDLRVMARELDALKGAYVKKAYMPHYEQIVLRVNPKEIDQRDIVFVRGARIYTSQRDRPMPMTPPPFAMVLRKHLRNARLTGVQQVGFDRVLAFSFDTKNGERTLYVEVFRDGNIILVDQDGIIIQPLTHASYAGRTLKKGVSYTPPPEAMDPYALDEGSLGALLKESDRDLVSTLGGKVNLGATHANAVCALAGHEPNSATSDADPSKVFTALTRLLEDLDTSDEGYLLVKPTAEDPSDWEAHLSTLDQPQQHLWLSERAVEATPILLPQHDGVPHVSYSSLCESIDVWKGTHDAHALQRREEERFEQAGPGRGQSTEVEKLERRKAQQEKALGGFSEKIEKQQRLGHLIQEHWTHVEGLLDQTKQAVERDGWSAVRKAIKAIPWIVSAAPADRTITVLLPDENSEAKGPQVMLELDATVHQNAQRYFESARKQKNKTSGAVEALAETERKLKRARKSEAKQKASGKLNRLKRSKRMWFEQHRWGMIEGGHLLVGGKDAKGNDSVVKKHLSNEDMYLHADLHGAPSCSLRSSQGFALEERRPAHLPPDIPAYRLVDKLEDTALTKDKLQQAAVLALSWSRAWNGGGAHGTVYSVKPAQVSKSAQTGEFVGKGAFVIRGQRTWYKDMDVRIGIGIIAVNGVPMVVSGTPAHILSVCQRYAILSPGLTKKDQLANKIYRTTGLSTDDLLSVLPGACDVIDEHGMLTPPVSEEE
ncbi:MAG TPA: fibronectin-binding domain-containing protein [Candidatus Poseidoniales archaeon]|nr:MAG TPA: fibronectin-binding domain-containing protein [Candidatus Poseidoniales archaeon]HII78412.1 fibronectin-binding domain-containing protein [Poseidonia sp.]|tara:strand:+ start:14895 stop:17054 length:2160 start_codon:yes stop_codon:yes gene_type:complete